MVRLVAAALVAAGAAAATPAYAQDDWYVRADAGYAFDGAFETPAELSFSPQFGGGGALEGGWAASLAVGRGFGPLRLEAELAHRNNDVERSAGIADGAEASATSLLVNAIFDFNTEGAIQPYIGVGAGAAQIKGRSFNNAVIPADLVGFDDDTTAFAYQALAGVGIALNDVATLDLAYRYFAAPDLDFSGRGPLNSPRSFEADYEQHGAFAGLRWRLGG